MMYDEEDTIILPSGRRFYAHWRVLGIDEDSSWIAYGADGGVETEDWTIEERSALADMMIARWLRFRGEPLPPVTHSTSASGDRPMTKVEPALAAEEWEIAREAMSEAWGGDEVNLHAVAALALDGQLFGFTWDDVDAIRAVQRMACGCGVITPEDFSEWMDAHDILSRLAERIAANLPPRES